MFKTVEERISVLEVKMESIEKLGDKIDKLTDKVDSLSVEVAKISADNARFWSITIPVVTSLIGVSLTVISHRLGWWN